MIQLKNKEKELLNIKYKEIKKNKYVRMILNEKNF